MVECEASEVEDIVVEYGREYAEAHPEPVERIEKRLKKYTSKIYAVL